ncbi:MAG: tRNA epoxyqueuosine(34) reductase QueG [Chloroflexota bacterium]
MLSEKSVKALAAELGFNSVGIAPAVPSPRLDAYFRWIDSDMHGEMGYMARTDRQARRRDLNVILPGVQSILMVGLDYHALQIVGASSQTLNDPARGRIAAYAWGRDYHEIMAPRLEMLATRLREMSGQQMAHKVYVDTGAVLERSHAQQAGLGFIGKNTLLINPRRGSYFFLGEILTDAVFDTYDPVHRETMCGSCQRCLSACPTNAFPAPYVLDARRCISYLTIEHKGWIDRPLRPLMGNWIYGCDVCQDVCPFSRFVVPTHEPAFIPTSLDRVAPSLLDLLRMDTFTFRERFAESPIQRIGRDRLVRNACIAAGNWGDPAVVAPLCDLLHDPNPLVRGHAVWALARSQKQQRCDMLISLLKTETDPQVREELRYGFDPSVS